LKVEAARAWDCNDCDGWVMAKSLLALRGEG
jgi:hypothetical protein